MTSRPLPQCRTCARYLTPLVTGATADGSCEAFLTGIPDEIGYNRVDHRQPYEGDHGMRWKSNGMPFPEWAMARSVGSLHEMQQTRLTKRRRDIDMDPDFHRYSHGWVPLIRQALTDVTNLSQLRKAYSDEVLRITGHRGDRAWIVFGESANLQTAQEHAEGILRVLERYPQAKLWGVSTHPGLNFAQTRGAGESGGQVQFGSMYARDREWYLKQLARNAEDGHGLSAANSPTGTAVHEMAHVVDVHTLGSRIHPAVEDLVRARASAAGVDPAEYVGRELGEYATRNTKELIAEAFANIMMRGAEPNALAEAIVALLDAEYHRVFGGDAR